MVKAHHLVIIPGLGDQIKPLEWVTENWPEKYGIVPHVKLFGWQGEKTQFDTRLQKLDDVIIELLEKGYKVSLLGTSAGGSAVINLFAYRKNNIHRVVSVCGRLYVGENVKPTLDAAAKNHPIFKESVLVCERALGKFSLKDKSKILTIRPFYDEAVPVSTQVIQGATNKHIVSVEHLLSISLVMTLYVREIIKFLKPEPDF